MMRYFGKLILWGHCGDRAEVSQPQSRSVEAVGRAINRDRDRQLIHDAKAALVIDTAQWCFIQHLGDIRNKYATAKKQPTSEEVQDLLKGVAKVTKSVF
jgi:hypothetical protein